MAIVFFNQMNQITITGKEIEFEHQYLQILYLVQNKKNMGNFHLFDIVGHRSESQLSSK